MEFKALVKERRSCRSFETSPISEEQLTAILDAGRWAPNPLNLQPWEFIAITDKGVLKKIASLVPNGPFIETCACCLGVICKDTKYYLEDGCAATENILIMASDLGLGACWVAGDKKPYCWEIMQMLKVPEEFKLISLIALGFSKKEIPSLHTKRSLGELLHWEQY